MHNAYISPYTSFSLHSFHNFFIHFPISSFPFFTNFYDHIFHSLYSFASNPFYPFILLFIHSLHNIPLFSITGIKKSAENNNFLFPTPFNTKLRYIAALSTVHIHAGINPFFYYLFDVMSNRRHNIQSIWILADSV